MDPLPSPHNKESSPIKPSSQPEREFNKPILRGNIDPLASSHLIDPSKSGVNIDRYMTEEATREEKSEDESVFHGHDELKGKILEKNVFNELKKMPYKERTLKYGIKERKSWELKRKAKEIVKELPNTIAPGIFDRGETKRAIFKQRLKTSRAHREHQNEQFYEKKKLSLFKRLFGG